MDETKKVFIKNNQKILTEIFCGKLEDLTVQIFDGKIEERNQKIDAINILRDWMREIKIIAEPENKKPNSFV
jgi:hypothetical protein